MHSTGIDTISEELVVGAVSPIPELRPSARCLMQQNKHWSASVHIAAARAADMQHAPLVSMMQTAGWISHSTQIAPSYRVANC